MENEPGLVEGEKIGNFLDVERVIKERESSRKASLFTVLLRPPAVTTAPGTLSEVPEILSSAAIWMVLEDVMSNKPRTK